MAERNMEDAVKHMIETAKVVPDISALERDAENAAKAGDNPFMFRHISEDGNYFDYDVQATGDGENVTFVIADKDTETVLDSNADNLFSVTFPKEELAGKDIGEMIQDTLAPERREAIEATEVPMPDVS